jgi:hypothetical protein
MYDVYGGERGITNVCNVCYRESLTFQLATLDRGLSSSEEDLLSVSDRNHTLDGTDSLASFDLPGLIN